MSTVTVEQLNKIHVMTTRVRNFTAIQQQNEKMIAQGKLSASLAQELETSRPLPVTCVQGL